jgi:hypothetical protein
MQNCRFEDNFTDFGLFGKVNTPIMKCDPPATNAVWGLGAVNPVAAVVETGMGADGKSIGVAMSSGSGDAFGVLTGQSGSLGSFGAFGSQPSWGAAASFQTPKAPKVPQFESCNPGEVDTGMTCDTLVQCKTEEDKSQPIKGPFGEFYGYFMKTTCTQPSSRVKKVY